MPYVYILESERNGKYYIGSTVDVDRRLNEHNSGKHHTGKRLAPFRIVFKQEFVDIATARKTENRLKKYKRRDFLEKIIKDGEFRAISSSGRAIDS